MFESWDQERRSNLFGGIVLAIPGLLAGGAWIWFSSRQGNDPPVWAFIVLGLGALGLASAIGLGLMKDAPDNAQGIAMLLVMALIIGGGWLWAKGQVGPVARAMSVVCERTPVPEAKAFVPGEPGPFHLIVLNEAGGKSRFTGHEADWRADTVEDTEIVACVQERSVLIQTCTYTGGSNVERFADRLTVRVMSAHDGRKIGSFKLSAAPRECAQTEQQGTTKLEGEVAFDELSERLSRFAQGQTEGA